MYWGCVYACVGTCVCALTPKLPIPRFQNSEQEGSSWIYPDAFEPYEQHIPPAERGDLIKAYHK